MQRERERSSRQVDRLINRQTIRQAGTRADRRTDCSLRGLDEKAFDHSEVARTAFGQFEANQVSKEN